MTWTPHITAFTSNNGSYPFFEEQIIANTKALIVRDMKAALDYFYPALDLPDFKEHALGQVIGNEFPFLAIGPRENLVEETDDSACLIEAARLSLYVGVTGTSPEDVTIKIMRYGRTLDAVIRTARQDFFNGMSNPFGLSLGISHIYPGFIGSRENEYFRSATLEVTVNIRER